MYNHAPVDYICPLCLGIKGTENEHTLLRESDIVYKNNLVTAFINSFFISGNEGHVIVVPNEHIESIYELSTDYSHAIMSASQKITLAMKKSYACDGITILQNNEPASNQHAFHYHMHVFPRYIDDNFYNNIMDKKVTTPEERLPFVEKIKEAIM